MREISSTFLWPISTHKPRLLIKYHVKLSGKMGKKIRPRTRTSASEPGSLTTVLHYMASEPQNLVPVSYCRELQNGAWIVGIHPGEPKRATFYARHFFERVRIACTKTFTAELMDVWLQWDESRRASLSSGLKVLEKDDLDSTGSVDLWPLNRTPNQNCHDRASQPVAKLDREAAHWSKRKRKSRSSTCQAVYRWRLLRVVDRV